jgi:hypothetical protein
MAASGRVAASSKERACGMRNVVQDVFGKGAAGGHHFVERGDAVAGCEFPDGTANGMHDAGDVVAGVGVVGGD